MDYDSDVGGGGDGQIACPLKLSRCLLMANALAGLILFSGRGEFSSQQEQYYVYIVSPESI